MPNLVKTFFEKPMPNSTGIYYAQQKMKKGKAKTSQTKRKTKSPPALRDFPAEIAGLQQELWQAFAAGREFGWRAGASDRTKRAGV